MKHLMASILVLLFATSGLRVVKAQDSCLRDEVVYSFASVIAVQGDVNTWAQGYSSCPANIFAGVQALVAAYNSMEQAPAPSDSTSDQETEPACDASQWRVIPIGFSTTPLTDAEGFKQIIVEFAIENNGQAWNSVVVKFVDSFVTTEGGFQYGYWQDPYSAPIPVETLVTIPPGFVMPVFATTYQVAETQNQFVVTLPSIAVACLSSDGYRVRDEPIPNAVFDLDNDVQSVTFPTSLPDSAFRSITEPIEVPDTGTLEFIEMARDTNEYGNEVVVLRFRFTNASQGYEAEGYISGAFVIGSDGVSHWGNSYGDIYFHAGPGQSSEVSATFDVPQNVSNLKLVWTDPQTGLPEIYNLPDGV